MKTILILGGNGRVGSVLKGYLRGFACSDIETTQKDKESKNGTSDAIIEAIGYKFVFIDKNDVDLTNLHSLETYLKNNSVDAVINLACIPITRQCLDEVPTAFSVNVFVPWKILSLGIPCIHISSDYVFSRGLLFYEERDGIRPMHEMAMFETFLQTQMERKSSLAQISHTPRFDENTHTDADDYYGHTKECAERLIQTTIQENKSSASCYIIRSSHIYSENISCLPTKLLDMIYDDVDSITLNPYAIFNPTYAQNLVRFICNCIPALLNEQKPTAKILHYADDIVITPTILFAQLLNELRKETNKLDFAEAAWNRFKAKITLSHPNAHQITPLTVPSKTDNSLYDIKDKKSYDEAITSVVKTYLSKHNGLPKWFNS